MKNKKITYILILLTIMPFTAFASDETSTPDLFFMTVKMFSVLAVVIGIILFCLNLLKKYMPQGNMLFSEKKCMKIVETLYLGPKKSVVLLKVASEYVLLGVSANEINYLKDVEFSDLDKVRLNESNDIKKPLQNSSAKDIRIQSIFKKLHLIKK